MPTYPETAAFALVLHKPDTGVGARVLGSAFMVAEDVFMTAKHVVDDVTVLPEQEIVAAFTWGSYGDTGVVVIGVTGIWTHARHDIALGRLTRLPVLRGHFTLAPDDQMFWDRDVHTVEYSDSLDQREEPSEGTTYPYVNPVYRKGNIVRSYASNSYPHRFPTVCYDLSYPAPMRASGAAVFRAGSGEVVGMIVGEHNSLAQAITAKYLRDALAAYRDWLAAGRSEAPPEART